jgi:anthranilate phosphoribosyltransferase
MISSMKAILNYLFEHKTLSKAEAKAVLTNIAKGMYSHSEIAAFISVYLMRSITVDELSGFRDALLELCIPVPLDDFDIIDLCGTGGDGKNTFNISTITSFVVAGAGGKVAKHGNYGVSSSCGSSNVMEYLGYRFSNDASKLLKEMDSCGICFIHAPLFNPAMKNVAPVRKEHKVKTFFNMLGPMVNPSFPKKQMVGVYSLELARLYNYLYQQTDKQFAIVHSLDGYDEISLTGPFKMITNTTDAIVEPEDIGFTTLRQEDIAGGNSIPEAAEIFMNVLQGKGTAAQTEVVIANAAMALGCYFPGSSVDRCIEMATDSLMGQKAFTVFKKFLTL